MYIRYLNNGLKMCVFVCFGNKTVTTHKLDHKMVYKKCYTLIQDLSIIFLADILAQFLFCKSFVFYVGDKRKFAILECIFVTVQHILTLFY